MYGVHVQGYLEERMMTRQRGELLGIARWTSHSDNFLARTYSCEST